MLLVARSTEGFTIASRRPLEDQYFPVNLDKDFVIAHHFDNFTDMGVRLL